MRRITFGMLTVAVAVVTMFAIIGQQRTLRVHAEETDVVRQGPQLRRGKDCGVGRQIADLELTDINGRTQTLSQLAKDGVAVIAMTGTGCPLCKKYAPTLAAIEDEYRRQGVRFVFVNPNKSEQGPRCHDAVSQHGFDGPYVSDPDSRICRALQADTTTEVFVVDSSRTLVYRGAVNDQYGFAYASDAPTETFLEDALDAVLADKHPDVSATTSPGCELLYDAIAENQNVTYHGQISRIIARNCRECHRSDGIAPMPFETYEQVKDYAGMIRFVTEQGIMPPWFADDGKSAQQPWQEPVQLDTSVHWANDRSLSERDMRDLQTWIAAGAPEGDPADAPRPVSYPDGWLIGRPDKVFQFDEPVRIKATGIMPYKNIRITNDLDEDKWIQAMEIRPSDPSVVHHVIVSVRGEARELDGYWAAYVPGNSSVVFPPGLGKRLPKGATLNFQMHYTPNGRETFDQTQLGLVYSDEPVEHEVKVRAVTVGPRRLKIPAGKAKHEVRASLRLPTDVKVLALLPHMHLRGQGARYDLLASGEKSTLLNVPRYDFNWQLRYELEEPRLLHEGDTLMFTALYNNSDSNPALKGLAEEYSSARTTNWGQQTYEEMHLGYVEYIVPGEKPGESASGMRGGREARSERIIGGLFTQLDVNGDGQVTRAEVQQRPGNRQASGVIFNRLDTNGDGVVDKKEFEKLGSILRR